MTQQTNTARSGRLPNSSPSIAAFLSPTDKRNHTPKRAVPSTIIRLTATETQIDLAASVALARTLFHNQRGRRPDQNLGSRNQSIDYIGALAEVLIRVALDAQGIVYKAARFFDSSIPVGPDLTIDGVTYNVKAIPHSQQFLMLNEEQRLDPRKASNFVLPVRFTSATAAAIAVPVPACEIADWVLREGHSLYRSCPVSQLRPLASWYALKGVAS